MLVVVVGLGEIGTAVTEAILRIDRDLQVVGVDVDASARSRWIDRFCSARTRCVNEMPSKCHWYSICVFGQQAILDCTRRALKACNPDGIVAVEATMGRPVAEALQFERQCVAFPHRFNPGDVHHHVFNLRRVIGGRDSIRAIELLFELFEFQPVAAESFLEAAMSKLLENAYRAMEIILAQECDQAFSNSGMDFAEVRRLANTKWNIDIREPRDGVKGKCLPKDLDLFLEAFPSHTLARVMRDLNRGYIEKRKAVGND